MEEKNGNIYWGNKEWYGCTCSAAFYWKIRVKINIDWENKIR